MVNIDFIHSFKHDARPLGGPLCQFNKNNKNNLNEDIPVLHLPDYDSDCEAIVEMVYATNEMMPRIITRELMSTLKLHNCNECLSCLINIDNTESGNSWEPTQHTVKLITDVFVIFNNVIENSRYFNSVFDK